tara:strand:+ start:669 stop:1271 length:603 start_codon:yes stop_codon:yes gene_type:complete
MALATIADVEARLGRSLTVGETSKASAYLSDASAMFVQRAVQKFEVSESAVRLFPKDGIVRLVQRPVIEIVSVKDIDGIEIDFTFDGHQSLYDLGDLRGITVNYEHGSANIPDDVVAVVAGMVARTLSISPDAAAGVQQQAVGPFSQSYATWAVGGQVMMSPAEGKIADYYRGLSFRSTSILGNGNYGVNYPSPTKFRRD